jgi:hypothetical protein
MEILVFHPPDPFKGGLDPDLDFFQLATTGFTIVGFCIIGRHSRACGNLKAVISGKRMATTTPATAHTLRTPSLKSRGAANAITS